MEHTRILELGFACLQMESYQQQLKEQQAKLHKASKQAQEAASKATAQQQVSFTSSIPCIATPWLPWLCRHGAAIMTDDLCSGCLLRDFTEPAAAYEVGTVESPSQLTLLLMQALQQQLAELEIKLVQARTDSKAQVKGHNTGKKELEVGFLLHLITCLQALLCTACYSRQFRRLLHMHTACSKSVGWPC